MGIDHNAIIGYGIVIHINSNKINDDIDEIDIYDSIQKICIENSLDFIHDNYWIDFDIFIGKVFYRVQNGNKTLEKNLTINSTLKFTIDEDTKNKIINICNNNISKYIKVSIPNWNVFTYNN